MHLLSIRIAQFNHGSAHKTIFVLLLLGNCVLCLVRNKSRFKHSQHIQSRTLRLRRAFGILDMLCCQCIQAIKEVHSTSCQSELPISILVQYLCVAAYRQQRSVFGMEQGSEPNVSPVGCRQSRNEANESTETSNATAPREQCDD